MPNPAAELTVSKVPPGLTMISVYQLTDQHLLGLALVQMLELKVVFFEPAVRRRGSYIHVNC